MADADLTPAESSLGQCAWAVVAATMDDDLNAVEYLLSDLTPTELGAVVTCLAGVLGHGLSTSYGREQARAMVAGYTVHYAGRASE